MMIAKCIRSILMRNSRFMLPLLAVLLTSPLLAAPQFYDLQDERPVTRLFQESGFGYSIRYPQDWIYTKPSPHTVIFSGKEGTEGYYSTVTIQNLASTAIGGKYISLDSVVDDLKNQLEKGAQNVTFYDEQPFIYVKERLKLEGREFKTEYLRQGEKFRQWVIVIPRSNRQIFHAWFYTSPLNQYDKYLNVARFVLSSWAIEDKTESTIEKPSHVSEAEDSRRFVHPNLGFSLVIPQGWGKIKIEETTVKDGRKLGGVNVETQDRQTLFSAGVYEPKYPDLMGYIRAYDEERERKSLRVTTVDGEKGYEALYEHRNGYMTKLVIVMKFAQVYLLMGTCRGPELPRWEPVFDQIVAGFRFEKEAKTSDAEKPEPSIPKEKPIPTETEKQKVGESQTVQPPTRGTSPVTALKSTETPVARFVDDDPCDQPRWPKTDVPWQTPAGKAVEIKLPAGVLPAEIPPFMDINKITQAQYAGAVSAAMEAMRLVYDDLTPEETQRFEAKWAPLFDFPTAEILDYFNKLNPLLGQFLSARSAFAEASKGFYIAFNEVSIAMGYGSKEDVREAIAIAETHKQMMESLHAMLVLTVKEIEALGNPPNPLEAKCRASQKYEDAHRQTAILLEEAIKKSGEWVLWQFEVENRQQAGGNSGYKFSKIEETALEVDIGPSQLWDFRIWKVWWKRPPERMKPGEILKEKASLQRVGGRHKHEIYNREFELSINYRIKGAKLQRMPTHLWVEEGGVRGYRPVPADWEPDGKSKPINFMRGWEQNQAAWTPEKFEFGIMAQVSPLPAAKPQNQVPQKEPEKPIHAIMVTYKAIVNLAQARLDLEHSREISRDTSTRTIEKQADLTDYKPTPENKAEWLFIRRYIYVYQPPGTKIEVLGGMTPDFQKKLADAEKKRAAEVHNILEKQKAKEEEIAAKEEYIKSVERRLSDYEKQLSKEQDPRRREELQLRILSAVSEIQLERGQIESIQTGKPVYVRTALYEYGRLMMQEKSREAAEISHQMARIRNGIKRQIALLPEDMRESEQEIVRRILDPKTIVSGDVEKAQAVALAVNKRLEGYWQGEAARQEEKLAWYELTNDIRDNYIEAGKIAGGIALIGLSGGAVASLGGGATAVGLAPAITGFAYGGVTGYVEGGPVEAVKQAFTWASPLTFMAVQAYEGFEKEGIKGAVMQAGEAYLIGKVIGKVIEYGVGFTRMAVPPGTLDKEVAQYTREFESAKLKVKAFSQYNRDLQNARISGAPKGQLDALQKLVAEHAADINASYHAKWYLKHVEKGQIAKAYNEQIEGIYKNMTDDIYSGLKAKGYDVSKIKLKPVRNASSKGSVGMDYDLMLDEEVSVLIKNGRRANKNAFMVDGQKTFNEAYIKHTERNPERSFLNFTTSTHPEAYKDPRWLGGKDPITGEARINLANIRPGSVEQAADVTQFKAYHIQVDQSLSKLTKIQEVSRGTAKDMKTKILPFFDHKIAEAAKKGDTKGVAKLTGVKQYWKGVYLKLNNIGTELMYAEDIIKADRELRLMTGGKGVFEVIEQLTSQLAAMPILHK